MEAVSPNEILYPYYDGESVIYITAPEYYVRMSSIIGHEAVKRIEE